MNEKSRKRGRPSVAAPLPSVKTDRPSMPLPDLPPAGLQREMSVEEREYTEHAVRILMRDVKAVESVDVARFLVAHVGRKNPVPDQVCRELGLDWPSVRMGLEASPELMGYWENFQHAAIDVVMAEVPEILADESISMPDRKAKATTLMQWAKMMNPKRFGDNKGGGTLIQVNVGDVVMEARRRASEMRARVESVEVVEDAGL